MIVLKVALEVLGAIVVVYFGVRVIATVGDVGQRTRRWLKGDKKAWDVEQE